jgi:hypothetical protein
MGAKKKAKAGPRSLKSEKRKKRSKGGKSLREATAHAQTREPFEQDPKRRIGQHVGTGEAPLMKK